MKDNEALEPTMSEKEYFTDQFDIPTPATHAGRSTRVKSIKCAARLRTFALALFSLSLWLLFFGTPRDFISNRLPAENPTTGWAPSILDNMSLVPGHPGGRHRGRRILNGKGAEHIFLTVPTSETAFATSRRFASRPHMAGTPGDFDTAIDFLHLLQRELNISGPPEEPVYAAGTELSRNATLNIPLQTTTSAWIDVYYPVMNTPLDRSLEIIDDDGHSVWKAQIEEVAEDIMDPDAGKYSTAVPVFHGLSRGGEVEGKLVYVNYGRKEDYDALEAAGVNFNGTIVIARYGGIFRGLKVKGAQDRGAVGCLIYSDLRDDGSVTWDNGYASYPYGPARNPTSVQRGSVQFISVYPGDPTTPGYPSYPNSTRTNGENIPLIPSLPISWDTASKLLKEIEEGGENRTIKLVNHVDNKVTPIWNAMGVIPGLIRDEVVVVGNHRDAWVLGATDPTSGTVSTYEMLRGLGVLLKKGWKPLRTIVIASWDAEEYGLIGSTEWGEDFADWIDKHVVAYLNLDSSVSGSRFRASASPSLAHLARDTAKEVPHPTSPNKTLWDARLDSGTLYGFVDPEVQEMYDLEHGTVLEENAATASAGFGVGPLGSGSDYTVFLQRIGIASANGGFGSTLSDPVYHYHSVFDSETWQERFGDPGFHRHVAVAKHLGLQLLRLADAVVLPLNTTQYAFELDGYLSKVEKIAAEQGFDADFSALRTSIDKLQDASKSLDDEKSGAERHLKALIHRWWKSRQRHNTWWGRIRRTMRKLASWIGWSPSGKKRSSRTQTELGTTAQGIAQSCRVGRQSASVHSSDYPEWLHRFSQYAGEAGNKLPRGNPRLFKEIIRAAKRVRVVNKKLVSFERGFISEDGIKDREWYRHLGVAPGKWLGYGATTFPALTEALTFEKNVTLAQYEAQRLEYLINALVKELEV